MIREIVQIQGVDEVVRTAKRSAASQTKEMIQQTFTQLKTSMPTLPKETWDAMQAAADKLMQVVQASWSPEEALSIWGEKYCADFTDDELKQVIESCKTPIGRKVIAAGSRANIELQTFLSSRTKAVMDSAVREYISEIQRLVSQAGAPVK